MIESRDNILLKVEHLCKYFSAEDKLFRKSSSQVKAVDDVSFQIRRGTTFALVGESGCGKSTTARLLLRLLEATSGKVYFQGKDVFALSPNELRDMRRDVQMIFQDPYSSLDPRWKTRSILEEPLNAHGIGTPAERRKKVIEMLEIVGLGEASADKYSHEFSGGQRQRIGIARALITNPQFIICDEPISALDVSIQAQIINLLKKLQADYNLTYLFITHDLRVVNYFCDEVGVMYLGRIVETGDTRTIFREPAHPYTRALFSSIPIPDPNYEKKTLPLEGDVPSPLNPPSGCPFHTRCPNAMLICSQERPTVQDLGGGHLCACHLYQNQTT